MPGSDPRPVLPSVLDTDRRANGAGAGFYTVTPQHCVLMGPIPPLDTEGLGRDLSLERGRWAALI